MKKRVILLFLICAGALSGCGLDEYLLQQSGIKDSSEYQQYEKWKAEEKIDENNYYQAEELVELESQYNQSSQGTVKVSIASNNYLNMKYYLDSKREQEIESAYCYRNPGESIYASQVEVISTASISYQFLRYEIYEYTENKEYHLLETTDGKESLLYTIPSDFAGSEVVIIPIGEYKKRKLKFNALYRDWTGKHDVISGVWKVNDEVVGKEVEIDSRNEYVVKYEYDPEEYYCVSSKPNCFSDTNGCVEFPKLGSESSESEFEVELHKFISFTLNCEEKINKAVMQLKVDHESQNIDDTLSGLKVGQVVSIEVAPDYRLFSEDMEIGTPEKMNDRLVYKVEIGETENNSINFTLEKKYLIVLSDKEEHGECKFFLDGKEVSGSVYVKSGQKLKLQYKLTDENYKIDKGFWSSIFGKKNEYEKEIEITNEHEEKVIAAEDYIKLIKKEGN